MENTAGQLQRPYLITRVKGQLPSTICLHLASLSWAVASLPVKSLKDLNVQSWGKGRTVHDTYTVNSDVLADIQGPSIVHFTNMLTLIQRYLWLMGQICSDSNITEGHHNLEKSGASCRLLSEEREKLLSFSTHGLERLSVKCNKSPCLCKQKQRQSRVYSETLVCTVSNYACLKGQFIQKWHHCEIRAHADSREESSWKDQMASCCCCALNSL